MADETFDIAHKYSVTHKAADGEHTTSLGYGGTSDTKAEAMAKAMFGDRFVSIKKTTWQEHATIVAKNLADNPSRTPLDEKTGGQMNRIVHAPELAEAE